MKIIEVFGLARSGHHAVTNWLIKNLCGDECTMEWKLSIMKNGLFYINEGNLDTELTLKYIQNHKDNIRVLILSYENCNTNFSILNNNRIYDSPLSINNPDIKNFTENYRVIFLRDFYNNLASRIKSNEKQLTKTRDGVVFPWDVEKDFIEKWKDSARNFNSNNFISLKFEDWLNNKTQRNKFLEKIIKTGEIYDNSVRGTHSSFGDTKGVMDRINMVDIPQTTKELIRKDTELHYLICVLGYDYKEI